MKITFQEASDLLNSADIVKLYEGDDVVYPVITFDTVDGSVHLSWDTDTDSYDMILSQKDNAEVEREGHALTFVDENGIGVDIELYREVPILP